MRGFKLMVSVSLWLVMPLAPAQEPATAPSFDPAPDVWISSTPLDWQQLRGKVVLLNVWTYGCGNCTRSLPWLKTVDARYQGRGFELIGIHSPEFAWEKPRTAVAAAVTLRGVDWPVMQDNELAYWRALGNRYWPAFYVVDRNGKIAGRFIGETHAGDDQARAIERLIETLLEAE